MHSGPITRGNESKDDVSDKAKPRNEDDVVFNTMVFNDEEASIKTGEDKSRAEC